MGKNHLEFSDAVDTLLENKDNGLVIVARVNNKIMTAMVEMPSVDDFVDDDNISEVGFSLGTGMEILSTAILKQFNTLVEEEQKNVR